MTGTGMVAAGSAAKAARQALKEDAVTNQALVELAKETDGFRLAAELKGQNLAGRKAAMRNLMRPIYWCLGVRGPAYFNNQFAEELALKTANIPDENLQPVPPQIAGPLVDAMLYSVDEETLRDMFTSLLASAADDRAPKVHPAYAEIIRQLDPLEAQTVRDVFSVMSGDAMVIAKLRYRSVDRSGFTEGPRHLLPVEFDESDCVTQPQLTSWVENWCRLSLFEVSYSEWRVSNEESVDPYGWVNELSWIDRIRESLPETHSLEVKQGLMRMTELGRRFAIAVFPERGVSEPSTS